MGRRARRRADGSPGPSAPPAGVPATAPRDAAPSSDESPPPVGGPVAPTTRASRTEAKNAAARAALVPLAEGERPRAVTVAAVVVVAVAIVNAGSYLVGVPITGGGRPPLLPLLLFTALLGVTAWGLWRARYWAVLGTQALLVLWILVWSLLLVKSENLVGVIISLAIIAGAGTLFWFLIRAMARIQMPRRR